MSVPTLYTIGYSGFTPETFVAALQAAEIAVVIDVRRNPVSRKPGFSRAGLKNFLKSHGVEYVHVPALGVPESLRNELREGGELGDYLHQFGRYLAGCEDALDAVDQQARDRRCCLMCLEKRAEECHRSVVAEELRSRANGNFRIEHLSTGRDREKTRELNFEE